jgi:hypothetical protein
MVGIANFRFPIADLVKGQSKIGNRQSAMKKSRAKQRGTSIRLKCFGSCFCELAELFSRLFYVAASRLNSPRFSIGLYAALGRSVNRRSA